MPVDPITGVQALSAVATLARVLASLHNAPDRVKDCLELVQVLHRDRQLLVELMNEHVDLKDEMPSEWRRLEEKVNSADRVIQEVGLLLQKYRPETRAVGWRVAWVIADADTLANKVPSLQMQQATILSEVNGLRARRRLKPVVAMAETVQETRQLENLNLLSSLMGKRPVTAEPMPDRNITSGFNACGDFTHTPTFRPAPSDLRHPRSFYDIGYSQEFSPSLQVPIALEGLHRRASYSSLASVQEPPPSYQASMAHAGVPTSFSLNPVVGFALTDQTHLSPDSGFEHRRSLPSETHAPPQLHQRSFSTSSSSFSSFGTDAKSSSLSALFEASRKPISKFPAISQQQSPSEYGSLSPGPFSPIMLSSHSLASEATTLSPGPRSPPTPCGWPQSKGVAPLQSPPPVSMPFPQNKDNKGVELYSLFGQTTVPSATVKPPVHEIDNSNRHFGDVHELDARSQPHAPQAANPAFMSGPPAVPPKLHHFGPYDTSHSFG